MRNDMMIQHRRRARPWRWIELVILLAFALCLAVGLGALYLLWAVSDQPAANLSTEQTIHIEQIVPSLALRHLAGDPLDGLAQQAIQAGAGETGHALLQFFSVPQPIASASLWLQLAQLKIQEQDLPGAAHASQMAQRIALLDPQLYPLERAPLLTQCAKTYADAAYDTLAIFAMQQVVTIASQTPDLLPAQRSQLFSALQPIVATLPESEESRLLKLRVDDFVRNPYLSPNTQILTPTLFSRIETVVLPESILTAESARFEAAKALGDRYQLTNGLDIDPERAALSAALLTEERVRFEAMQPAQIDAQSLAQQVSLLRNQREWLTTRLRIAKRGYGIPIVPSWEADIPGLLRDVSSNTDAINALFEREINSQSDPQQQVMLRLQAALWLAEQAEIGLYSEVAADSVGAKVQFAQDEFDSLIGSLATPLRYAPTVEQLDYDLQQR